MKKLFALILTLCFTITLVAPNVSASVSSTPPLVDQRVVSVLNENNIEFQITNGYIKLKQTSPSNISKANHLLTSKSQFNLSTRAAANSYDWQYMRGHDVTKSQKFTAATKTAFAAAFTAWAKDFTSSWQSIVGVAVGGFGTYYFVNSNTEDIVTNYKYFYRDMGGDFLTIMEITLEITRSKKR